MDLKHTIDYISPDISAILGYYPQEIIGKNFNNFVILSDLPDADKALENVISDEKVQQLKVRIKSKDRKMITLIVKLLPIISKRKVTGVQGIFLVVGFPEDPIIAGNRAKI